MNKENYSPDYPEKEECKRGNPETPEETRTENDSPVHYFRDNLQKQKEETKRSIEEKMKNTLKGGKNKPTFFKDKKE